MGFAQGHGSSRCVLPIRISLAPSGRGPGRGGPVGELEEIVGEADEAPFRGDLLDAAQEELAEAARLLDLTEHRLGQLLS